jgi:hypothetical protein
VTRSVVFSWATIFLVALSCFRTAVATVEHRPRTIAEVNAYLKSLPDSGVFHIVQPIQNLSPDRKQPWPLEGFEPNPAYPDSALKSGIGATVLIAVQYDNAGSVVKWHPVDPDHPNWGFEKAIGDVIEGWRFTSGAATGNHWLDWVVVMFTFKPGHKKVRTPEEYWVSGGDALPGVMEYNPGDSSTVCLAEETLCAKNAIGAYRRESKEFLQINMQGEIRPAHEGADPLQTACHFIDDYQAIFGICDPRQEIRYVRDSPWALDSVRKVFHGRQMNRFCFAQFYDDHPVVNSFISVDILCDSLVITQVSAQIVFDPSEIPLPHISSDQALEKVNPLLEGPDRHCRSSTPRLSTVQDECCSRLVWTCDLTCGPDIGFAWGEQVWVDAVSGELLKTFHTWIE